MKNLLYLLLFVVASSVFFACNEPDSNSSSNTDSAVVKQKPDTNNVKVVSTNTEKVADKKTADLGIEYTAKYICPNHCKGSGSDKAGECSNAECGMELMENPNYKEK